MSLEVSELHRRHTPEPELVPILDALTCIIFFLMYTTTFMELTSLTLPPAAISVVTPKKLSEGIPLVPKIFVDIENNEIQLTLQWSGDQPGSVKKSMNRQTPERYSKDLEILTTKLLEEFSKKYPNEKSIQLGISENGSYQELITIMDGVRKSIKDIILVSPDDVKSHKEETRGS